MTYEQHYVKWKRKRNWISVTFLSLAVVYLLLFVANLSINIPAGLAEMIFGGFFLAIGIHQFSEPLPPETNLDAVKKKKKSDQWRPFYIFLGVVALLIGVALFFELPVSYSPSPAA
jgi:uncharacterized membrane protein YfcA